MLPFLGGLVEKDPSSFLTCIYRKPTFTGLYISWDSFTPKSRKIDFVKCLTHLAFLICSNNQINAGIQKVTDIFLRNVYPENVLLSRIRSAISKFNTIKSFGLSKCRVLVKILWIGPVRQLFADKIFGSIMCYSNILR